MTDIADVYLRANSKEVKSASRDLDKLDSSSRKVDKSTGQMAKQSNKANKAVGGLGTAARAAVGPLLAVVGAGAAFGAASRTVIEFESAMSRVGAISRATADEMVAMERIARDLGSTTSFSATQAADGLRFLSQAGFTASESIAAIPDVLNLARAAALDLGTAADIASNVMSGFGIEATEAAGAADILAAISSRANTNVQQLGDAASYVGPVASAMGVSLGDASAAIGVLSDAGIQGSAAGTGLRRVLSSLANPTKDAAGVLNSLGLELEDVNPATNSLTDVIDRLAGTGIDAAEALTIFGDRGGPAILSLVAQNDRVRELADEMGNVSGEAQRMADVMADNLEGDVLALKSALGELSLELGDTGVSGGMRSATQGVTNFVRALSDGLDMLNSFTSAVSKVTRETVLLDTIWGAVTRSVRAVTSPIDSLNGAFSELSETQSLIAERDIPGIESRLVLLNKKLEAAEKSAFGTADAKKELRKQIAMLEAAYDHFNPLILESTKLMDEAEKRISEARKEYRDATVELAKMTRGTDELTDAQEEAAEEAEKLATATDKLLDNLYPYRQAAREAAIEVDLMNQALERGVITQAEFEKWVDKDVLGEVASQAGETKSAVMDLADEADPLAKVYERGLERMRDGFGDFFKDLIVDGKASLSGLVDLFKGTIAEMIATAASNRILVSFGLGGGSTSTLASSLAGGGSGGGIGSISDLFGGGKALLGGFSGIGQSLMGGLDFLGSAGSSYASGLANTGFNLTGGTGFVGTDALVGGAANLGAGVAGGYLGTELGANLFGKEAGSSFAATAGGMLGSFLGGPLGAFAGAGLGGILDSAFGTGSGDPRKAYDLDFAAGTRTNRSYTSGSEMDEATDAVVDQLFQFAQSIGGSNAEFGVVGHSKDGFFFANEGNRGYKGDTEGFIEDAMQRIIEGAEQLDPVVKELATSFSGSAQELQQYIAGLQGLKQALDVNPVEAAISDFSVATENASMTLMGSYDRQLESLSILAAEYDGSAAATAQLNAALSQSQQTAYNMAMTIQSLNQAMGKSYQESAQAIRESILTEEELINARKQERRELRQSLGQISDPEELANALSKIEQTTLAMFENLEDPSEAQVDRFATYLERTQEAGERRFDKILTDLGAKQEVQQEQINDALSRAADRQEVAASQQVNAANLQALSAEQIAAAVNRLAAQLRGGSSSLAIEEIA